MNNTEIVILAAGKGTRMGTDMPKCILPVKGIPMIQRLLTNIQTSLVNKALVVVGHKSEDVISTLGDKVRYVHQKEQKGTAHATKVAIADILPTTKSIVVLYADHPFVSSGTIENLVSGLSKSPVSIAITDAGDFGGWKSIFNHYGRIISSKNSCVDSIVEFKDASDEIKKISHVNCGYYAFDVVWLKKSLEKVTPANAQGEYYLTDVIKIAREEGNTVSCVMVDPFEALGLNSKVDVAHAESLMN